MAGCNGAGKTTASFTLLPGILNCQEFVNADEIARGLSPFRPDGVAFKADKPRAARNLKRLGVAAEVIRQSTGRTRAQVERL